MLVRVIAQVWTPIARGLGLRLACVHSILDVRLSMYRPLAHQLLHHDGLLAAVAVHQVLCVLLAEARTVALLLGHGHGGTGQVVCFLGADEVIAAHTIIVAVGIARLPSYVHFLCGRDLISPTDVL